MARCLECGHPTSANSSRLGYVLLTLVLAVAGCGILPPKPNPGPDGNTADQAAAALAAGLSAKDLSPLPFVGATGAAVNDQFQPLVAGMGPLKPGVTVASVSRDGSSATAKLSFTWTFPGVPERWTYQTEARLAEESGQWKTSWQPSIVQPQLDGTNRLSQRRLYPERGELRGEDGVPIVVERPVFRIGIDKSKVSGDQAKASAVRLAKVVKINPRRTRRRWPLPATALSFQPSCCVWIHRTCHAARGSVQSRERSPSERDRCSPQPTTLPGPSSGSSVRQPRRTSTSPAELWWPEIRSD